MKKEKQQSLKILRRSIGIIKEVWPGFLSLTTASSIIVALKPLIALFYSSKILNELSSGRNIKTITIYVLITVISIFVLSAVDAFINQKLAVNNTYNYEKLEFLYVKKYMMMDYSNVEDSRVNQMLADIRARASGNGLGILYLSYSIPAILVNFITLILSIVMLSGMFITEGNYTKNFITAPITSCVLIIFVLIGVAAPLFVRGWQKEAMDMLQRENPKANTLFYYYEEYKKVENAAKDIRLYSQAKTITNIFDKRLNLKMWIWFFRRIAFTDSISGAVGAVVGGLIYLFIGLRALFGMYPIGSVVQYIGAVTNIIKNLSQITASIGLLLNNIQYIQNIYEFLDLSDLKSSENQKVDKENIHIEFKDVSFKYPESDSFALKDVNLSFKSGQRLAVVGMNGSGKTTMVKLLSRLYKPTKGVILLNGRDIWDYDYDEYMGIFTIVFQDFMLFSLPLGENIATSKDYDKAKAEKALQAAGFVPEEKGLDTYLKKDCDKNGINLSGGEEQKVAIARAIYRDSPFAVFDEPTAALDPISEYEIYTKLNDIVGNKTAVFISHRLSSCRFCDDIAVFDNGLLIQYGSHETLLRDMKGKYYELWTAQAQHYTSETK